jgi:hypothetical protein
MMSTAFAFQPYREVGLDLLALLAFHRCAEASDPRDKVFALFGLSRKSVNQDAFMVPDCNLDTTVVFENVAKRALELTPTLDILSVPKLPESSLNKNLPSWVPDWSEYKGGNILIRTHLGEYHRFFEAARNSTIPKFFAVHDRILKLRGFIFDQISAVGETMPALDGKEKVDLYENDILRTLWLAGNTLGIFSQWERISQCKAGKKYPTGEDSYEAYLKTLFMGDIPEGYHTSSVGISYSSEAALGCWCSLFQGIGLQKFPIVYASCVGITIMFSQEFQRRNTEPGNERTQRTLNRKIMRTRNEYIGLAPHAAQKGDIIALAKGARVPLVLRPKPNGNWELVGDIYVHGIMLGEAFEEHKCEEIRIE